MARQQSIARDGRRGIIARLWLSSSSSFTLLWLLVALLFSRETLATSPAGDDIRASVTEELEKRVEVGNNYECTTALTATATMATTNVIGTQAPPITLTGNSARPFSVENDTFTSLASAKQRSCSDQFNACQLMANDDTTAGFTVSECQNQQNACLNDDAVQVSSSSTSTTEQTATINTTTSTTTSVPPASTSSTSTLQFTSTTSSSSTTITNTNELSSMLTAATAETATEEATITTTAAPLTASAALTSSSTTQPYAVQQTTITQDHPTILAQASAAASTPSPNRNTFDQSPSSEKMIEILPQQPVQLQYLAHQQQQSMLCRHSAGLFQYHTPASPSPLGLRNANIFPTTTMSGRETAENDKNDNIKFGGSSPDQENTSPSFSRNIFSFSPTNSNNTVVTPPPKQSTYEARFRNSGGSKNPFTKIFGSSSSPSPSGGSATKHRQLFLNKVKQNRDNARFGSRGETLMMMEYHSEQQNWDAQMRQKADTIYQQNHLLEEHEDGDEDEDDDNNDDNEQSALEQFLMQEEEPYMDTTLMSPASTKSMRSDRASFCGDDGDYDDIFMELVDESGDTTMSC
ncbi:hypothetical protein UA08_04070 [Talaromyces atroroseus]|uniref:Uncharacterized protein n=1 Tax=Talaromyces atroroseus TaxID=1441469 RepID=A0A1Q5Q8U4_TALAT|nr:hypothetical protein UA08_04070 [Talaromyces atroroseus]OKL60558.1 hypothetical protein UA08_04070 [Talaromyces atroroseus]